MLGVLKGSILVRAILCVVHTFGNAYRCSLLEKFVSAVYRSWRGSFVHHICSKYVNKKQICNGYRQNCGQAFWCYIQSL